MLKSINWDLVQRALRTHAMVSRRFSAADLVDMVGDADAIYLRAESLEADALCSLIGRLRATVFVTVTAEALTFEQITQGSPTHALTLFRGDDEPPPAA